MENNLNNLYNNEQPTRFARVLQSCCKGNNMIQLFR